MLIVIVLLLFHSHTPCVLMLCILMSVFAEYEMYAPRA